jgi:glycosyltransferase involved in cell wall biosynthesis
MSSYDFSTSFIIAAFNEEKYIGNCITAIRAEMANYDYPFEIIVIDNNSTDRTYEEAKKARADLVVREHQQGVTYARNRGLRYAMYRNVAIIDADAQMPLGWYDEAMNGFYEDEDDETVVAVSGPLQFYDTSDAVNYSTKQYYKIAKAFHHLWPTMQGGNYIVRRDVLEKMGGFPNVPFYGEDTMTAVEVAKHGKIVLKPEMYINTSGRRLNQDGLWKTTWLYVLNYLSANLIGAPATNKYENFR